MIREQLLHAFDIRQQRFGFVKLTLLNFTPRNYLCLYFERGLAWHKDQTTTLVMDMNCLTSDSVFKWENYGLASSYFFFFSSNAKEDEGQNPITGMKVAECLNPTNIWKPTQA